MKLIVERDALAAALADCCRVVERKVTIPTLANVKMVADGGALHIKGTNLDQQVDREISADVEADGETCVPAHLLDSMIKKLPSGSQVGLEATDKEMVLKCGRRRSKLATLLPEDFPDLSAGEMVASVTLPGKQWASLFSQVAYAICKDETRYYLNGVYLDPTEDGFQFVATDGHRMACKTVSATIDGVATAEILPTALVNEIIRLTDKIEADVDLEWNDAKARLSFPGGSITSKLVDGRFPDYQRLFPANNERIAKGHVKALAQAADYCATIADEVGDSRARKLKMELADGESEKGIFQFSTFGSNGESRDEVEVNWQDGDLTCGCNAKYMADVLGRLKTDEVTISFRDAGTPYLFEPVGDPTERHVLMPMRV